MCMRSALRACMMRTCLYWLQAWEQEGTALVVSERLLNCPPQLVPPLHQALFDEELPWATEDEPSAELRDSFRFRRFLMTSRVYADYSPAAASGSNLKAGPPEAKRKKAKTPSTLHQKL